MNPSERQGALYILLSVTGYAMLPVFVKTLQDAGIGSQDIALLRFGLAAPLFWLIAIVGRGLGIFARPQAGLPVVRLLALGSFLSVASLVAFWGFERLPAGTFVVLFYTYPAMVALLSLLLGDRLYRHDWLALGLTMIGIAFSTPDFLTGLMGGDGMSSRTVEGVLLALLNALIVAVYFIINSRLLKGRSSVVEGSALNVTGALLLLLLILVLQARPVTMVAGSAQIASLVALALFGTVMPVFFLTAGIQKLGPARASILGTVEPILTALFAALFLNETMGPMQWVGAGFIIGSVVLLQVGDRLRVAHQAQARSG